LTLFVRTDTADRIGTATEPSAEPPKVNTSGVDGARARAGTEYCPGVDATAKTGAGAGAATAAGTEATTGAVSLPTATMCDSGIPAGVGTC
jgi:hypothetical protein